MTDTLIARLRFLKGVCDEAADRIEALQAERDAARQSALKEGVRSGQIEAERDQLRAELGQYPEIQAMLMAENKELRARLTALEGQEQPTYSSTQATKCACCGVHKHTPLRVDFMGGYVCLTCIDMRLAVLDDTATMYAKQVAHWIEKHDALLAQQLATSVPPEWTDESVIAYCVSRGILAAGAAPTAGLPFVPWSKEAEMRESWAAQAAPTKEQT